MNDLQRATEQLDEVRVSIEQRWDDTHDTWLDQGRSDFESLYWLEIEDDLKQSVDVFDHLANTANQANKIWEPRD